MRGEQKQSAQVLWSLDLSSVLRVAPSVQAGSTGQCLWSEAFGFLGVTYNQAGDLLKWSCACFRVCLRKKISGSTNVECLSVCLSSSHTALIWFLRTSTPEELHKSAFNPHTLQAGFNEAIDLVSLAPKVDTVLISTLYSWARRVSLPWSAVTMRDISKRKHTARLA